MMIGQPTPEQFEQLEAKNAAVTARQTAVSKISPAKLLQNAIRSLGVAVGDSKISKLAVDGKIGPKTVAATNYTFATYLNAPNKMSAAYIQQHINYLQTQVTKYVEAHGGVVDLPVARVKNLPTLTWPTSSIPTATTSSSPSWLPEEFPRWGWWVIGGVSALVLLNALSLHRAENRAGTAPAPRRRRQAEAAAEA